MYDTILCGIIAALQVWTVKTCYDIRSHTLRHDAEINEINKYGCKRHQRQQTRGGDNDHGNDPRDYGIA